MTTGNNHSPYPGDCAFIAGLQQRARERAPARGYGWRQNLGRARHVRLLLMDVDGVLTDGSLLFTDDGRELKTFNARDGFGITLLHKAGIPTGIITARQGGSVAARAAQLGITHLLQGERDKLGGCQRILAATGCTLAETAYVGDDWLDLPLLTRVGLGVAVADAAPEVRERAHYVTAAGGGRGAVREVAELILEAQGRWQELLERYLAGGAGL